MRLPKSSFARTPSTLNVLTPLHPAAAPTRGVVTPLVQLSPSGTFDMFALDIRHSLQEGLAPDFSTFWRFPRVCAKRRCDLYTDFFRLTLDLYNQSVSDYSFRAKQLGLTLDQLALADATMANPINVQVGKMISSATEPLHNEQKNFDAQISVARNQIATYKGNPPTLTMPLVLPPDSIPAPPPAFSVDGEAPCTR